MWDVLIIGGGIAGLSTAHALGKRNAPFSVLVIEREDELATHASTRNSGMIHHYHPDREMRERIARGAKALFDFEQNSDRSFLRRLPSLFHFSEQRGNELREDPGSWGDRTVLRKSDVPASLKPVQNGGGEWVRFNDDALIDPDGFIRTLREELEWMDVSVHTSETVRGGRRENGTWTVTSDRNDYRARAVVNAAGAWADPVGERLGAGEKEMVPRGRHLFVVDQRLLPPELGFYWDHRNGIYFRQKPEGTLLSVCDNHPVPPDRSPDVSDPEQLLEHELVPFYPPFDNLSIRRVWSCKRTSDPSDTPMIAPDPDRKNLFWVAGLKGHGITASMWIGERASRMVRENLD